MAREARFLHADSLSRAIYQASSLLAQPIDRLEVIGSKIHVGAGGQRVVFQATQSQTYNREGTPTLGGTSGEAVLVSGPEKGGTGLLGRLNFFLSRK
ncbi:MAG TPA: hypothetical protein VGF77_17220 [Allosphingosinicella sp.]|jgi:hypothetical protein